MKFHSLALSLEPFFRSQCPSLMMTDWTRCCCKVIQSVTGSTGQHQNAPNVCIPSLARPGHLLHFDFAQASVPVKVNDETVMRSKENLWRVRNQTTDCRFTSVARRCHLDNMTSAGQKLYATLPFERIATNFKQRGGYLNCRQSFLGSPLSRCFHSSSRVSRKDRKHPKDRPDVLESTEEGTDVANDLGSDGTYSEDEEYDNELDDENLTDELYEEQVTLVTPEGGHKVIVVQPNVKWGAKKQHLTTGELMLAESVALVETLPYWTVVDTVLMSTKTPDKKMIFGKGNFQTLTEKIQTMKEVTAVFLSVEALTGRQQKEMEEAWGVPVFDRYTVVLQIFKDHARTKEAKLQIALAEIPYLKTRISEEVANLDQQRGGVRTRGGGGETFRELRRRVLRQKETAIKKALVRLKKKRDLLRLGRTRKEIPVVSVVGYTNSGKTTLIKALTGEERIQPQDQLFATLDVTAHAGQLPSKMTALYVDTVGFLSQLPHHLIASFNATLEDVRLSDLIVHIRDVSHPDTVNQKHNVLEVLNNLQLPQHLLDNMIEANNKIDLLDGESSVPEEDEDTVINISALQGTGLDRLREVVEEKLFVATDTVMTTLRIPMAGPQLSQLYKNATVQGVQVTEDAEHLDVDVIMGKAAFAKFMHAFKGKVRQL
ncbi:PREDICTED: putative GTP-binding protein 6 [Branchiostoma belcheri]|uniref:Putative GTP-binding protein 6 n=1 Tax=Branchiostoma belcheri TaxID=7741 RepID=A0A6P5AG10_BRABE|nr:PREDICTED: putative GTP-binding protein 6 [Branchiostoma belcheri]